MISPIFSAPHPKGPPAVTATEMPSVTILTNPGATANRRDPGWLGTVVAGAAGVTEVEAGTPAAIAAAVRHAVHPGPTGRGACDILVVNGGDGTADLVFSALMENGGAAGGSTQKPALFILPSGKTNMTTAAWCGATDKTEALSGLLDLRRQGGVARQTQARTIMAVRRAPAEPLLHGAFLGAADVVDGILMCRRSIYPLGLPNALSHAAAVAAMAWRALVGGSADLLSARWPSGGEEGAFFFVGVTTLDHLILGLAPAPAEGDGGLCYLSLGAGPRALTAALPAILSRRIGPGFRRTVRRAEKIVLRFSGAYTLDGELYEADAATPIEVSAAGTLPFIKLPSTKTS
jgi:hypothetical protein